MSRVDLPVGPHEPTDRPGPADAPRGRRVTVAGVLIVALLLGFVSFWTWALFFASKESINKIDDRAWADRAEAVCVDATAEREELADYRRIDPDDPAMLRERGDLIDRSTDVLERMLDDVTAVTPADPKGRELVPQWEADYRGYIASRREYADITRAGRNEPFREQATESIPISERLRRFAADNEMPSCSPPRDL